MFDGRYDRANLKVDPSWQERTVANKCLRTWTSVTIASPLTHQREMERIWWCKLPLTSVEINLFVRVRSSLLAWSGFNFNARRLGKCAHISLSATLFSLSIRNTSIYIYIFIYICLVEAWVLWAMWRTTSLTYNDRLRSWEWLSFRSVANENAFFSPCYRIVRGVMLFFVIGSKRFYNVYQLSSIYSKHTSQNRYVARMVLCLPANMWFDLYSLYLARLGNRLVATTVTITVWARSTSTYFRIMNRLYRAWITHTYTCFSLRVCTGGGLCFVSMSC